MKLICEVTGGPHIWSVIQVEPVKVKVCDFCGATMEEDRREE